MLAIGSATLGCSSLKKLEAPVALRSSLGLSGASPHQIAGAHPYPSQAAHPYRALNCSLAEPVLISRQSSGWRRREESLPGPHGGWRDAIGPQKKSTARGLCF